MRPKSVDAISKLSSTEEQGQQPGNEVRVRWRSGQIVETEKQDDPDEYEEQICAETVADLFRQATQEDCLCGRFGDGCDDSQTCCHEDGLLKSAVAAKELSLTCVVSR